MKTRSYKLGFVDLFNLLFKKKVCRKCGKPLKRKTREKPGHKGWDVDVGLHRLKASYVDETDVTIYYECESCHRMVRLCDL